jgi:hypothetical protein
VLLAAVVALALLRGLPTVELTARCRSPCRPRGADRRAGRAVPIAELTAMPIA